MKTLPSCDEDCVAMKTVPRTVLPEREYWDLYLKNSSKTTLQLLQNAMEELEGTEHDRYEENWFKSQSWRNPLTLRISLPRGKRFAFILKLQNPKTKRIMGWLDWPARVGGIDLSLDCRSSSNNERYTLKGNHNDLRSVRVRNYVLHQGYGIGGAPYIKDYTIPIPPQSPLLAQPIDIDAAIGEAIDNSGVIGVNTIPADAIASAIKFVPVGRSGESGKGSESENIYGNYATFKGAEIVSKIVSGEILAVVIELREKLVEVVEESAIASS